MFDSIMYLTAETCENYGATALESLFLTPGLVQRTLSAAATIGFGIDCQREQARGEPILRTQNDTQLTSAETVRPARRTNDWITARQAVPHVPRIRPPALFCNNHTVRVPALMDCVSSLMSRP